MQCSIETVVPVKVFFLIFKEILVIFSHLGVMCWNQFLAASKSQSLTSHEFCMKIQSLLKIKLYKCN